MGRNDALTCNLPDGRIYQASGHPAFLALRPCYCFVPAEFIDADGFRKSDYLASRWPGISCGANPLAIGSHIIPDLQKPANLRSRCPVLAEFLRRLEILAVTKSPDSA
jgi:hypothetical protein